MRYEGTIYRPPSEARSLIIQATIGCSHNKCTFCVAYKDKKFRIRSFEEIKRDIDEASFIYGPQIKRVFLADGDALIMPHDQLKRVLEYMNEKFPMLERVGIYGDYKAVLKKGLRRLEELRDLKLGIIYYGVESGDDVTLRRVKKGADSKTIIEAGKMVVESGITLSCTVILGLGGRERSKVHAEKTGEVLSAIDPKYAAALTLMVVPGTPLYDEVKRGEFILINPFEALEELYIMLSNLELSDGWFHSNHASNYLPLKVKLPQEKEGALSLIKKVLDEKREDLLRPEFLRAL